MAEFPAASPQNPPPSSVAYPQTTAPSRSLSPVKWAAIIVVLLLAGASLAGIGAWTSWVKAGRIAPGVSVQGQELTGLTAAEAKDRLEQRFGRLFVDIQTDERPFRVSVSELGGTPDFDTALAEAFHFGRSGHLAGDVTGIWSARSNGHALPLRMHWDKDQLRTKVWAIAGQFNTKPKDATLQITNDVVTVVPHQPGRILNVGATCAEIQKAYFVGKPAVEAISKETLPKLVTSDLEGKDVKLGSYTTRYDAGLVGRTTNIHVASGEVDGTVLEPGQDFSFNRTTGERTWDKGYRMGHIFERMPGEEKSKVVEGLAGGVCQVSTTLYNAVRRTNEKEPNLKIIERSTHSLPVTYVSPGLDATVAWPGKDFRFRNTFPYPVYLRAVPKDGRLNISVWARVKEG